MEGATERSSLLEHAPAADEGNNDRQSTESIPTRTAAIVRNAYTSILSKGPVLRRIGLPGLGILIGYELTALTSRCLPMDT